MREFNNIAHIKWPPHIQVDDSNNQLRYTCYMPATVPLECIELNLRGNRLELGIHHTRQLTKQDQKGATVFDEQQSVNYSTSLRVPQGTSVGDISTSFNGGYLVITVSKNSSASQDVGVTQKK